MSTPSADAPVPTGTAAARVRRPRKTDEEIRAALHDLLDEVAERSDALWEARQRGELPDPWRI